MEEKKQNPKSEQQKPQKKWDEMTPEEKKAAEIRLREELRRYYEGRPSRRMRKALMGEDPDE